jgi:hypothetical protein
MMLAVTHDTPRAKTQSTEWVRGVRTNAPIDGNRQRLVGPIALASFDLRRSDRR